MLNRLSPANIFDASEVEHGFDLREMLSFAWRRWKFIGVVVGGVLLIGMVSLLRETPRYTATSQVLLDPQSDKMPGPAALRADVNLDLAMIESQMAIIRSTVFLRRVVEKERLFLDPEFGSPAAPSPASAATSRSAASDPHTMSPEVLAAAVSAAARVAVEQWVRPHGDNGFVGMSSRLGSVGVSPYADDEPA